MKMNPKVSVIVPCYKQAQFLDECLQSVLDQTYENWECIIVNDGSPDNTDEVADKWVKKDNRFKYLYKENGGLSSARNAALEVVTGDYIQFLDSDDLIHREKFSKSLSGDKEYPLIVSQYTIYRNQAHLPGYKDVEQSFLTFDGIVYGWDLKFSIPIHCALIHKKLLEGFLFDTTLTSCEDWVMWIYITKDNPDALLVNEPLAHYRKDVNDNMSADPLKIMKQRLKILPTLKKLYGEEVHDKLAYHIIEVRTTQLIQQRKEFQKMIPLAVVSRYLSFKKFYYKLFRKKVNG